MSTNATDPTTAAPHLKDQLKKALTTSMKARDAIRTQTIRQALSAIQKKEIDQSKDLSSDEIEKVLLTLTKQLQETIEQAKSLSRDDLVTAAEGEIAVMREFLPQPMTEADVLKIATDAVTSLKASNTLPTGNAAMGAVMKIVMAKVGSRSEGKIIQSSVRKALGLS